MKFYMCSVLVDSRMVWIPNSVNLKGFSPLILLKGWTDFDEVFCLYSNGFKNGIDNLNNPWTPRNSQKTNYQNQLRRIGGVLILHVNNLLCLFVSKLLLNGCTNFDQILFVYSSKCNDRLTDEPILTKFFVFTPVDSSIVSKPSSNLLEETKNNDQNWSSR